MNLFKKIKSIATCNLLKTIYFNFKMLPWKQARKLPVVFYGKVQFRSLKGSLVIAGKICTGMIRVGVRNAYVDTSVQETIWTIKGTVYFAGPTHFNRGSYILVARGAELYFGTQNSMYGSDLRILCFKRIRIGNRVRISWECQIYDTSFHYIEFTDSEKPVQPLPSPVEIGDRVWLGNRTTVSKGAVIPSDTIVASNSMVNKDFSSVGPNSILAGIPATVKFKGVRRIFDKCEEARLDKEFGYPRTGI